jgi:hypothetical protein
MGKGSGLEMRGGRATNVGPNAASLAATALRAQDDGHVLFS